MRARSVSLLAVALAGCGPCSSEPTPPPGAPAIVQRITRADQLIGGREAAGRIGDWLIANDKVRFIVQDAASATGWGLYGGSLVDVDRVHPGDDPVRGDDRLQEIFYQCELRAFAPSTVEVVADGTDGGPGVLRLSGEDKGVPLLDAVVASSDQDLGMTVEYALAPGAETLEIALRAKDLRRTTSREVSCGPILIQGDGLEPFLGAAGSDLGAAGSDMAYFAAGAWDATSSWVLYPKEGTFTAVNAQAEVLPLTGPDRSLPTNGTAEERFYVSVGARGDAESALEVRRKVRAEAEARRPVRLTVKAPDGLRGYLDAASVLITDPSAPESRRAVTAANADASGLVRFEVPAGTYAVQLLVEGRDEGASALVVPAGDGTFEASVDLHAAGELTVRTTRVAKDGRVLGPTAAKLTVIRGKDAPPTGPLERHGYVRPEETWMLPAGDYTVYVSRGPEYEYHKESVTVPALGKVTVDARVVHSVDTTGWVGADLHVHSTKSTDANASRTARVLGAIGEGLEILVSTEHDVIGDYAPFVKQLGLEGMLDTVTGIEVSPLYGHMNAYPVAPDPSETYWSVKWFKYKDDGVLERMLEPVEIIRALHEQDPARVVQANHPRGGSALFDYIRLDPSTGQSAREWPAPDACEVLNSKGGGEVDQVMRDLIGLIKAGRRITATGVSDSHGEMSGVGYARTLIRSAEDEPGKIDHAAVWRALKEGRAIAYSGPFATLAIERGGTRAEIGDTLSLPGGGPVRIAVKVQAPSWMDVARLSVLENGEPRITREIRSSDASPSDPAVRLEQTFTATVAGDAFYMLVVEGSDGSRNEPVIGARARTITNPVFVDVDGNGFKSR